MLEEFNNIEEFRIYIQNILILEIEKISDDHYKYITKLSSSKYSRKFNIDKLILEKEFNEYKKIIHNKYIASNKLKKIKSRGNQYQFLDTKNLSECICIKKFKNNMLGSGPNTYQSIHYYYKVVDNDYYVYLDSVKKIIISHDEFKTHFIDKRNYTINQLRDIKNFKSFY